MRNEIRGGSEAEMGLVVGPGIGELDVVFLWKHYDIFDFSY